MARNFLALPAWVSLHVQLLWSSTAGEPSPPWIFELSARQGGGLPGSADIYSVEMTVGQSGPLNLLVDTGSASLVCMAGGGSDEEASDRDKKGSFLSRASRLSTISYAGASVSGTAAQSQVCFLKAVGDHAEAGGGSHTCLEDFPTFDIQHGDAGFSQLQLDGVLGLAPTPGGEKIGLPQLDKTILDAVVSDDSKRMFGLFISPGPVFGPSELSLGGYDASKVSPGTQLSFVNLAQPSGGRWEVPLQDLQLVYASGETQSMQPCDGHDDCRVLVDSGTSNLEVTASLAQTLFGKLNDAAADCKDLSRMPDMHITLPGEVVLKLGPEHYMAGGGICSLRLDQMSSTQEQKYKSRVMILGQPFLKKFYTAFDQGSGRIGFAPSVATSGETRNEQHHEDDKAEAQQNLMAFINGH